jgi:hypothetical protein
VHRLARRAAGSSAGWLAMLIVALSPVFITAVLEAKPHLPSACMILWATLSALDYHARGRRRDALRMGAQAGYAFGLVLTGIVAGLLWPVLLLSRPAQERKRTIRHLAQAGALALLVWGVCNPYMIWNALFDRQALASNLSNSTAMYAGQLQAALHGAVRVGELLLAAAGPGVLLVGLAGLIVLWWRHRGAIVVAAICGAGILVMAVILGADKPAEFARFLILPVLLLSVSAAAVLIILARRQKILGLLAALAVVLSMPTGAYWGSFARDAGGSEESRLLAALYLRKEAAPGDSIGVLQEPAPYAVPPLDFAHRRVLLLPEQRPAEYTPAELPEWLVFTADSDRAHAGAWWHDYYRLAARFPGEGTGLSPITWADKPVYVYRRQSEARSENARRAKAGGAARLPALPRLRDATVRWPAMAASQPR